MILKNIFLLYPVYMFMYLGVCVVTVCVQEHLEIQSIRSPGTGLMDSVSHRVVPGTEPGFSGRAASVLNYS